MLKKLLTIVLVLLATSGAYALYQELRGVKAELADVKKADDKARETIAAKNAENALLLAANAELRAKDAAGEVEKAALKAERDTARRKLSQALEDLKTAPPENVLAQTQGWLDTREIYLRSNAATQIEAVFSIPAFRLNGQALAERQYLKFTLVPNMERDYEVQGGQLTAVRTERDNLTIIVANKDVVIGEKDKQISVRDIAITSLRKRNLWRTVGQVAGGVAAGIVIGFTLGK